MGVRVEVGEVAEPFRSEVRERVRGLGSAPTIVGFLANEDPEAMKYAKLTMKACQKDGLNYEIRTISRTDLEEAIAQANADPAITGIMIYYPAFGNVPSFYGGTMDDYLRDSISPEKDIEGLCFTYRHNLYRNIRYLDKERTKKCVLPCTALSIVKIMESLKVYDPELVPGEKLRGKTVTIFNRSEIVGRPLAAMLANDGAEIYSVDIASIFFMKRGHLNETEETAETACKKSDVIITGVPSANFKIPASWIKENAVIINFSHFANVDEAEILKIEGVRYVPQIGRVTIAMLERNAVRLYENFGINRE